MIYYHNLGYEDSLTRDIFLFFDDHIEELEEFIVGRCQKIDAMFGTGEFDAHFVEPLLNDLDVKEAWQILHDTWDESRDILSWEDERDPDMKLIARASYTYGKNIYETMCGIYNEIGDAYEEGVAEKGCDGGASRIFMKAYTVVKETYVY